MNGPVEAWSMNVPMDYATFTAAPLDIQQSYIDAIQGRFGVTISRISTDLFGLSRPALHQHMASAGLKGSADLRGSQMTYKGKTLWKEWLSGGGKAESGHKDASGDVSNEQKEDAQQVGGLSVQSIAVEWMGEFDPAEFMRLLARLPVPAGTVRIKLEIGGET